MLPGYSLACRLNANEVATFELEIPHGRHCSFDVLAMDGVYLDHPLHTRSYLLLVPGGRVDVAVRCREAGEHVLSSNADSSRDGDLGQHGRITQDVLFLSIKAPQPGAAEMALPTRLPPRPAYMRDMMDGAADETVDVVLSDEPNSDNFQINGKTYDGTVERSVQLGSLQELVFRNEGSWSHPMHLHLNHFQVVGTSGSAAQAEIVGVGQWRDTIPVPAAGAGGTVTVRFRAQRYCGDMPVHCHILHHGDMGMMTRLTIVTPDGVPCAVVRSAGPAQYCGAGTHWSGEARQCMASAVNVDSTGSTTAGLVSVGAVGCILVAVILRRVNAGATLSSLVRSGKGGNTPLGISLSGEGDEESESL